ncbi:uncharacterized protein BYT42DRAFT_505818 [Radiomyces spectabilis]|uniref:uncharacterized protein n=1 Tax=Radiomyces spectabilis TaxID=64574 RepID=UPI002220EAA4|nr:uncharacterized protein BYT42DRAFT_505818 [Radiomyces spectabilis]KAI8365266.1 hypothetical protein BYT42DRAFT_505818 [Radiomyces spectabilis]
MDVKSENSHDPTKHPHKRFSSDILLKLYGIDVGAAAASSAMVAPFIAVVDRSIIENLNGKRALMTGLKEGLKTVFTQPHRFVATPQFQLVFGLYFSTYITANLVDTTCEQHSVETGKAAMLKFMATSTVNMLLCIYKDRSFTRMFGASTTRKLPFLSYLLFAARDSMTIAASFTAPVYFASKLQEYNIVGSAKSAGVTAQLICPASVQFLSTPLHLYALDLYNRPSVTGGQRVSLIRKEYFKSTLARCARIGPAFGIGGVGNTFARSIRNQVIHPAATA